MQGIKEFFPYLWQLNEQTNILFEPIELARDLIAGSSIIFEIASKLDSEEREYASREISNTIRFLDESIEQLSELRAILGKSSLIGEESGL